jgi:hypothetical protein
MSTGPVFHNTKFPLEGGGKNLQDEEKDFAVGIIESADEDVLVEKKVLRKLDANLMALFNVLYLLIFLGWSLTQSVISQLLWRMLT